MAIVVLGIGGSGTSLVAGLLHKLGICMGFSFAEPDPTHPFGYWEDRDFWALNKALLKAAGGSINDPPPIPKVWSAFSKGGFGNKFKNLIRRKTRTQPWGFKDPRTALVAPVWHSLFVLWEQPKYVVVHREREDLIDSRVAVAESRGRFHSRGHWEALAETYDARIVDFLDVYHPERLPVSFEELTQKTSAETVSRRMASFCGVDFSSTAMEIVAWR